MGGCRCAYRNCLLRTDGKTHMFHFPVFDKVRCHQWLTNAQKQEFLNLKVSQLKNRVVCQHHFRDDNFMNFKKDKLTFDAVPTEDGPYCFSNKPTEKSTELDGEKVYTITLEDIENEYMTLNDKKANFSVKYGDFLTNCDLMDLDILNHNDNSQIDSKEKAEEPTSIILNDNIDRKLYSNHSNIAVFDTKHRYVRKQPTVEDKIKLKDPKPSIVHIQLEEFLGPPVPQNTYQNADSKMLNDKHKQMKATNKNLPKEKRIKIISEQKISEPVPLPVKLELLSPSMVLPLPKKIRDLKTNVVEPNEMKDTMIEISIDNLMQNDVQPPNNKPVNVIIKEQPKTPSPKVKQPKRLLSPKVKQPKRLPPPKVMQLQKPPSPKLKKSNIVNKKMSEIQTNISTPKSKMPQVSPERVAAIEQKRKFNMKLRDIIETCLDKLDDQEKISERKKCLNNKVNKQQQVASYLSTEPKLPRIDEYAITYLEEKMKKMEDNLINKINQNSDRIIDLKKSFPPQSEKKSVLTQTTVNEELHKKHLYQEISKFLSPDANSLIFEELFINKYAENVPKCLPSGKRRKCR